MAYTRTPEMAQVPTVKNTVVIITNIIIIVVVIVIIGMTILKIMIMIVTSQGLDLAL